MLTYNLIGDIHGRSIWRELVREDAINVFLGDYLDPYPIEGVGEGDEEYDNMLAILHYKQQHPETILLLGNHDLHYLWDEHYSRYNDVQSMRFAQLLRSHWHLFQAAFAPSEQVLVTHAGVTRQWCALAGIAEGLSATELADAICQRMQDPKQRHLFDVETTFLPDDYMGMSPTASPLWVRPQTLLVCGQLLGPNTKPIMQIVGHTQIEKILSLRNIFFIDCLGHNPQSLLLHLKDDGTMTHNINIL